MSQKNHESKSQLLIVDDEEPNIKLLTRIFKDSCVVHIAKNGQQALQMIEETEFDVILLDIMMPGLNGLDLLRTIRRMHDIIELPVVLISALSKREEIAHGIRLGANDYITKPFDADGVRARVTTQIMMKRLVNERHRHIDQLQRMNELQARMMQVASHDLKNPLNNLKMLTKIMKKEAENPDKIRHFVDIMDTSIMSMLGLIEDLLDRQFATSANFAIQLQLVDSNLVVRQVMNQYAVAAHNKKIKFVTKGDLDCLILADANRLQQVLGNLLSNAIKYSPVESTVTICGEINDSHWRLYIVDEGPGIPKSEHPHLFQPFSTGKISTQPTGGESSTGLGLWIVKQMIELQDGTVGVEFPEEGGSAFWLELALAPQRSE